MRTPAGTVDQKSTMAAWLIVLLVIRITSYFMLSESVPVTQLLKVTMRLLVTGASFIILWRLFQKNTLTFAFEYPLAIFFYLCYLGLGLASLLWTSGFADSLLQLLMDIETLVFCLIFMGIISAYNSTHSKNIRLSQLLANTILVIIICFIAGMYIAPEKFYRLTHGGEVARLGGFIINPNELGMLIVTGFAMCCTEMKHSVRKGWLLIMMALFIYTLLLTGSRSSMIGLFLIILFYLRKSGNLRLQLAVVTCMVLSVPFIVSQVFIKAGDLSEVLSMTGRIPFWKDLLTINFPKEPIFGYGFMRIDYNDRFESLHSYAGEMTHNTFIQVLMNLGLAGLLIVVLQMACTLHPMITVKDADRKLLAAGIFIPVIINSFTEFGIFGETNYGIMLYLFIVFMYGMKVNKAQVPSYTGAKHGTSQKNQTFRPSFTP